MKKKTISILLVMAAVLVCSIGGTLAWLTDKTETVVNTFTTSDIEIELDEETGDTYKMIPGWAIDKEPLLTVKKGSEDCWLFIKVTETPGKVTSGSVVYSFEDFIAYNIDENNWTQLTDENGTEIEDIYYCYAKDIDADRIIKILAGGEYDFGGVTYTWEANQVLTKPTVTKEMMNAYDGTTDYPSLSFTAYASQYWKNNTEAFTAYEAWKNISNN